MRGRIVAPARMGGLAAVGSLLGGMLVAQGAVQISPATLPNWTVNAAYSQSLTATGCGASCLWSFSGTLPPGLTESPVTGAISGTPVTTGNFSFTVQATPVVGNQAPGSQAYTVVIHTPPAISSSSLPAATTGTAYAQTISVSNGTPPYTFSVKSGALPAGLTLNASSGALSGTPGTAGTSNFTIAATDQAGVAATQAYTLTVNPGSLTITTASPLPGGTVGAAYSQQLAVSGGTPPLTWSIPTGTLPAGLLMTVSSGLISGTPTSAGSFTFTIQVADSKGAQGSKSFTLTIAAAAPTLTITSGSPLATGTVGTAYSQTLAATGGTAPYAWSIATGNLPPGISLNSSSGALTGTPTSAGTFDFSGQVTDNKGATASKAFRIPINTSNLTITSTSPLPDGIVGTAYSQTLTASGGQPPYSWTVTTGALPAGLRLAPTGALTGTPTAAGASSFTVQVNDSASAKASQQFSITVSASSSGSGLTIAGAPATAASSQQIPIGVNLSAPATSTVTGQIALSFQPAASVNKDDPSIQFSTGGRTVSFTIPAGSVHATFSAGSLALQTGTVAGTIQLNATSNLPGGTAATSIAVGETAPVISAASVTTNSSGFQLQISGYSNSLELASASFHFTAQSGQTVQTGDLTANLATLASQWFGGSSSSSFGGQFLILVPFTVQQGAVSGLASVSVQLQNSKGTSAAVSANF